MPTNRVNISRFFQGALLAAILAVAGGSVNAQFLLDEEKDIEKEKKEEEREPGSIIPGYIPLNINAEQVKDVRNAIRIAFEVNPKHLGEYVVIRSNEMIASPERAMAGKVVKILKVEPSTAIIDTDCPPGSYYYAVVPRSRFTKKGVELFKDVNYTSNPVVIGSTDTAYAVTSIRAVETAPQRIRVTWSRVGKSGMSYAVYRGTAVLDTEAKVRGADRITTVTDRDEFIDESLTLPGTYYYAVMAREQNGKENMVLIPDQTYTTQPVTSQLRYALESMIARNDGENVEIQWSYTGQSGENVIQVVRSPRKLFTIGEVKSDMIIGQTTLDKKSFVDAGAPAGEYYYALMPPVTSENKGLRFTAGVNITSSTVVVAKREKEKPPVIEDSGTVDEILRKYYYPGKYYLTLKYLKKALEGPENDFAKAKARLYIGRTYIELRKYRTALEYLLLPEVRKQFPREAAFWRDYALGRLK